MTDSNIISTNQDSHSVNVQEHASILTTVQAGIASAKQELEYWKSQQQQRGDSQPGLAAAGSATTGSASTGSTTAGLPAGASAKAGTPDPVSEEIKRLEQFIAEQSAKLEKLAQDAIQQGESFLQEVIHYVDIFGAEIIAGLEWLKSKLHL
jgi:hypothetical protein